MLATPEQVRDLAKDLHVLGKFVAVYCRDHHVGPRERFSMNGVDLSLTSLRKRKVCAECRTLLSHAVTKRIRCPFTPKPSCRLCTDHCYAPKYRQQIREVMKFSGRHLILRGQLHLLFHFLERPPREPPARIDRDCGA